LVIVPQLLHLGRAEEALAHVSQYPFLAPRALLALGRSDEAVPIFEKFMSVNRDRLTTDEAGLSSWMIASLMETAVALGDATTATTLLDLIADAKTVTGGAFNATSIDRHRGAAAAFLGEREQARAYYETGIKVTSQIGFRPELALTRFQLAQLLLEHYPEDRDEALAHLDFAISEFHEMQMAPALEKAIGLKLEQHGISDTDVHTSIVAVAQSVEDEHPDIAPQAAPDGTVTILFTDIAGSTVHNERLGDMRWMELLRDHNDLIRTQVAAHRGYEVKNQGDGFMLAFGSAVDGLRCAIGIQEALVEQDEDGPVVAVRIGLHTGEAIKEDDDFFGRHVALAARIGNAAQAGQILASGLVQGLAASSGEFRFDRGQDVALKGIDGPQRVHRVLWRPEDTIAPYPDGLSAREVEVLQQLAQGKSNAEIADALVIASATVARHVSNILNKTALANRTEAATYAATRGLLD
jgi:class 3 adenylate cyclase